jgi:hypothetical protein
MRFDYWYQNLASWSNGWQRSATTWWTIKLLASMGDGRMINGDCGIMTSVGIMRDICCIITVLSWLYELAVCPYISFSSCQNQIHQRSTNSHILLTHFNSIPPITYYWTGLLILDHSYLVENLKISKIAETKASEPLKSWHFCISNFWAC